MEETRNCPICGDGMKKERNEVVVVDVCDEHGVWFDKGELERVMKEKKDRIDRGVDYQVRAAKQQGRIDGAVFDWYSLFFK